MIDELIIAAVFAVGILIGAVLVIITQMLTMKGVLRHVMNDETPVLRQGRAEEIAESTGEDL